MNTINIDQITAAHPVPWIVRSGMPGVLHVIDARGVEVQLLTVLDFVKGMSIAIAQNQTAAATS